MYRGRLEAGLPEVREKVAAAAKRVGRSPGEIRIVGVTKGHPLDAVEAALEAGLCDLGENRIDELESKAARVSATRVRWHMVGHVQRRRAPVLHGLAHLVHSLDSMRLAERLETTLPAGMARLRVLVQVNVSGEATKGGFSTDECIPALERLVESSGLDVQGLMTMAPFIDDEAVLRKTFSALRELNEEARERLPAYRGRELSMGMSNDYELAVEEGSTIVRIGTALFGERVPMIGERIP
jgi:pyridoxal phosphate enzyme (YggS family)